jgi:putative tricarboxylic transport membrane protein
MTREIAAVAVGLAVAALALREALGLPIGAVRHPGEGFFPLWLAVLLVLLSLLLLSHTLRARAAARARSESRIGQVIGLVAALAVYTAILEWVGYPIATFFLVLYMVKITHPQRWLLALGISLLAAGGSYLLFAVWLKVPLPPGAWRS